VLRDPLAAGGSRPSVRLTRIFRQAALSGVVTNAHRINAGDYPQVRGVSDFYLFPADDADAAAQLTVDVVTRRIPARFGLNPRRDIPVLALMHRCPAGAAALNTALQDAITPARAGVAERRVGGRVFRVGDRCPRSATTTTKAPTASSDATLTCAPRRRTSATASANSMS
jgi:exodeoxyribonuclease V alpha subunit